MSWIELSLTRLEKRLRSFVEGDFARDGIPRKLHHRLLHELVQAMQSSVSEKNRGENSSHGQTLLAPDEFILVLPAEQAKLLLSHPAELDRLAKHLKIIAGQSDLILTESPILRVVANPTAREPKVLCDYCQAGMGDSLTLDLGQSQAESGEAGEALISKPFLIINGLSTYPLNQPVINIGSDPSNQVVLNNPDVARMHAQMRLTSNRFVIFDLDSKTGTLVNGVSVSSRALNPGDVIRLAGVPLVYGQEAIPSSGNTRELLIASPPPPVEIL